MSARIDPFSAWRGRRRRSLLPLNSRAAGCHPPRERGRGQFSKLRTNSFRGETCRTARVRKVNRQGDAAVGSESTHCSASPAHGKLAFSYGPARCSDTPPRHMRTRNRYYSRFSAARARIFCCSQALRQRPRPSRRLRRSSKPAFRSSRTWACSTFHIGRQSRRRRHWRCACNDRWQTVPTDRIRNTETRKHLRSARRTTSACVPTTCLQSEIKRERATAG